MHKSYHLLPRQLEILRLTIWFLKSGLALKKCELAIRYITSFFTHGYKNGILLNGKINVGYQN